VLVPKTAVEENYFPPCGKNEIGFARQIFSMEPKAVTKTMHEAPQNDFRGGAFRPDLPHVGATAFWAELIHGVNCLAKSGADPF